MLKFSTYYYGKFKILLFIFLDQVTDELFFFLAKYSYEDYSFVIVFLPRSLKTHTYIKVVQFSDLGTQVILQHNLHEIISKYFLWEQFTEVGVMI